MPRTTFKKTMVRAASALAITVALAAPAASGQTLRGVTAPTAPPASNDHATVTIPPATVDGVAVGQPSSGGALAPPLLFHVDPNAFTPLARPVIIPPRATAGSPFGLTASGVAVPPTGDLGAGTSSGAGVPIDPSGGVIVTPAGGSARGDLLAGPSLRRGAGATRNLTIGGETSGRLVMPRENFGNVSRFTGDVVITNRESGRTRIVTR